MKNILFLVFLLLVQLINIPTYALVRGNDIYPICDHIRDEDNPNDLNNKNIVKVAMNHGFQIGYCIGIVGTSFQAIRGIGYAWSVSTNFSTCMENYYGFDDIDGVQILDMMMKYLKNHPEKRNLEVNIIMASMLHDYYPSSVCSRSKKQ